MPYLNISEKHRLWYEDDGSGDPVLFVHGWCMSSAVWQFQRSAVVRNHRFLALDLGGHGHSTFSGKALKGFDGYAADIISIIELLNLERVVLAGWSMGAQALLRAYPAIKSCVSGILLVGATPRFTASQCFEHGLSAAEAEGMRLKVRRSLDRAIDGFCRHIFRDGEMEKKAAGSVAAILSGLPLPSPEAALDGLEALMNEEMFDELKSVECPTLVIHGDCDIICLPSASEYLVKSISGSRRICYEGVGHAPFLSCADRFNQDLIEFVSQVHAND